MTEPSTEPLDKYRVTMTNVSLNADGSTATMQATDYVRVDHLDAYLAGARSRWQAVEVSEEPDFGPGGPSGETSVPADLDVPDAGVVYTAEGA